MHLLNIGEMALKGRTKASNPSLRAELLSKRYGPVWYECSFTAPNRSKGRRQVQRR